MGAKLVHVDFGVFGNLATSNLLVTSIITRIAKYLFPVDRKVALHDSEPVVIVMIAV